MSFLNFGSELFSFCFGHFWKCCKREHQRRQANVFNAGMDCVLTFFDIVHQRRQANVFNAGMDCGLTFFDIVGVNYDMQSSFLVLEFMSPLKTKC